MAISTIHSQRRIVKNWGCRSQQSLVGMGVHQESLAAIVVVSESVKLVLKGRLGERCSVELFIFCATNVPLHSAAGVRAGGSPSPKGDPKEVGQ